MIARRASSLRQASLEGMRRHAAGLNSQLESRRALLEQEAFAGLEARPGSLGRQVENLAAGLKNC